ncbi:hypothetical protein [Pseudomonas sp. AL03]|uniref:hypothetical protein n=1 Tax=Pseudomonas sp. AL03 TaxID=3042230 RepID=UPI002499EC88|nr:hypothetical protein [Pseudomonas sp. AL03]MDI3274853.1 hypothetical protein [Pseudomonas sp. AL03]
MTINNSCECAGSGSACLKKTKKAPLQSAASQIASEALELLRATHERLEHMTAVFNSVSTDLKHNHSHNVKDLAALGGFLGDDWANYVDSQVGHMQKELDLVEAANE